MLKFLLFLLSPVFLSTQRVHVANEELSGPQIKNCIMPATLEVGEERALKIAPDAYFYDTDGDDPLYLDIKPLQGGTFGEGNYAWIEFFEDRATLLAKPKEDNSVGSYPFQIIARNRLWKNASQVMIINIVSAHNRNNIPTKTTMPSKAYSCDDKALYDTVTILLSVGTGMVLVSIFSIIGEKSRRAKRKEMRKYLSKGEYVKADIVREAKICNCLFGISNEEFDEISCFVFNIPINKYNQYIETIADNKRKNKKNRKRNLYRPPEEVLYEGQKLPMIPE